MARTLSTPRDRKSELLYLPPRPRRPSPCRSVCASLCRYRRRSLRRLRVRLRLASVSSLYVTTSSSGFVPLPYLLPSPPRPAGRRPPLPSLQKEGGEWPPNLGQAWRPWTSKPPSVCAVSVSAARRVESRPAAARRPSWQAGGRRRPPAGGVWPCRPPAPRRPCAARRWRPALGAAAPRRGAAPRRAPRRGAPAARRRRFRRAAPRRRAGRAARLAAAPPAGGTSPTPPPHPPPPPIPAAAGWRRRRRRRHGHAARRAGSGPAAAPLPPSPRGGVREWGGKGGRTQSGTRAAVRIGPPTGRRQASAPAYRARGCARGRPRANRA